NFNPQVIYTEKNLSPHSLYCADNGDIWAGGDGGFLGRWHDAQWELFNVIRANYNGSMVRSIAEDGDQNLWLALNSGDLLSYRDGQFTHFGTQDGLPGSMIHCIFRDS